MRKIPLSFFNRSALLVAKEVLGCYLVTETDDGIERYMITETEAYVGPHDLASHSSKGRTKRTEVMYGIGGTIYIYLIYGMHNMLNIVTGEKNYPAAVLIRGVERITKDGNEEIIGPGNVAKALHISRMINGMVLSTEANLWVEIPQPASAEATARRRRKVIRTPRIGIDYAGPIWANKNYRFILSP
jgi:DNA-3-methyladenine glycosylase